MAIPKIDEFIKQYSSLLSPKLAFFKDEFEIELSRILKLIFQNLDIVTREEFEVQTQLLAATRNKLEKLEQKVLELEKLKCHK